MSMIGYRYSVDDKGTVYIIKLIAPHEIKDYPATIIYHSDNCICESITNANTGNDIKQALLHGVRRNSVLYTKGEIIPGTCWFCHSVEDLYKLNYLFKGKDGLVKTKPTFSLYDILDKYIDDEELTRDEVAAEMKISTAELLERINRIKQIHSIDKQKTEAAPIMSAISILHARKVQSGEIMSGLDKYLMVLGIKP